MARVVQACPLEGGLLERVQQDVGRSMNEEPEPVGGELVAGTSVGGQVNLRLFYVQLHGTPAAVQGFVCEAGIGVFRVCRDETHVGAAVVHLYLDDHQLVSVPAAGLVVETSEQAHLLPSFPVGLQCLVRPWLHPLVENPVARQGEHELHVIFPVCPVHEPLRTEMGVTAHDETGLFPVAAHHPYQPAKDAVDVGRLVTAATPQHGKDHLAGDAIEDEQGHVAVLAAIIVEKRSLPLPVSVEAGVVAVEDDASGLLVIGGNEPLHEANSHLV